MTPHSTLERALRVAAGVALGACLAIAAAALVWSRGVRPAPPAGGRLPATPPLVIGLVQWFAPDTIVVVPASAEWMTAVHVDRDTVVTRPDAPATLDDIRPGMLIGVWGRAEGDDAVRASLVLVPAP